MSIAQAAKRRRRQAANEYRHLSEQRRPKYHRTDKETAEKRLARAIATERRIKAGSRIKAK